MTWTIIHDAPAPEPPHRCAWPDPVEFHRSHGEGTIVQCDHCGKQLKLKKNAYGGFWVYEGQASK